MGLNGESHHVDGIYLGEINDGDNGIYVHDKGTTINDIQRAKYYGAETERDKRW